MMSNTTVDEEEDGVKGYEVFTGGGNDLCSGVTGSKISLDFVPCSGRELAGRIKIFHRRSIRTCKDGRYEHGGTPVHAVRCLLHRETPHPQRHSNISRCLTLKYG